MEFFVHTIDVTDIEPVERLFHNQKLKTYSKNIRFEEIDYWEENLRTMLAFDMLTERTGKKLSEIPLKEVTKFFSSRDELNIAELANSIEMNGVRVPLIILDDGTLLDGNRRYFACSYIFHEINDNSEVLNNIPVWVIKSEDVTDIIKYKILAEANFVSDMRIPWTLDVKANLISRYFHELISTGVSEQEAYLEIKEVYDVNKSTAKAYIETVILTDEYVGRSGDEKELRFSLRNQVLKKFVYFWEFRNKALNGRGQLDDEELSKVKPLFFKMIENSLFKSLKQIEPMVRSIRDQYLWEILCRSKGTKIEQVDALFREKKTIRSAEDKVRNFLKWYQNENKEDFTSATLTLLEKLSLSLENHKKGD